MTNERMCAINENSGAGNAENGVNGKKTFIDTSTERSYTTMEMMNGKMPDEMLEKITGGAVGADTEEGRLLWEDLLREIHTELNRVEYETDPIPDRQRELYRNAIKAYEACIIALRARGDMFNAGMDLYIAAGQFRFDPAIDALILRLEGLLQ